MSETVYNSNNEQGMLKSIGPYRLTTADKSIAGVKSPRTFTASTQIKVGTKKVYGTKISSPSTPRLTKSPTAK